MADLILIIELVVFNEPDSAECYRKFPTVVHFSAKTRSNQLCWSDCEMETARFCHIMLHSTRLGIISELKH